MDLNVFNKIDELANLKLSERNNIYLYKAARKSDPLSLETAKFLVNSIEQGSSVIVSSGFPILPGEDPETDGPPGAIALTNALAKIGANPILALDEVNLEIHLNLKDLLEIKEIEIEKVPTDYKKSQEFCRSLLGKIKPDLLISIEKPGMNQNGVYYNMRGSKITSAVGKVDTLFSEARKKGIPTIGIGDGGNEIGMGNISQTVKENIVNGGKIASITKVDQLFVSTVSNWGAYGILSALSLLKGIQLMHDEKMERRLIEKCVDSGGRDGINKKAQNSVDNISCYIHEKVADMFHHLVSRELQNRNN